ncbi:MAG TPA: alpha-hydroxy-acid oxidizing protein, partial [Ktedonobacteraceae bacterium]|nr:alpha-hydroxy-acid oxidizing protein [Ktedonobacteraceae bacterium]
LANERMSPEARGYLDGMVDSMSANRAAFARWRIVPRMLRDVSKRDLRVELFGKELPVPFLLAPIGVQSIVHADGEVATARAAASVGVPMIQSTAATRSLEEVASALGDTPSWYQLYWSKDPDFDASIVQRAEQAGYQALVVTLDTTILAWRPADIQNAYLPFLLGEGLGNYLTDPAFRKSLPEPPETNKFAAIQRFIQIFSNPSLAWKDLAWLRERTKLPILLKGILHPDDARMALDSGMNGLIVSNHGGRQVEGVRAALNALPGVAAAVDGRVPVLFDSGIRRAADVFKAIALGAQAVLLGRPYMWGLALNGQQGVEEVLRNFLADLDLTLALSGHTSYRELDASALVRED